LDNRKESSPDVLGPIGEALGDRRPGAGAASTGRHWRPQGVGQVRRRRALLSCCRHRPGTASGYLRPRRL